MNCKRNLLLVVILLICNACSVVHSASDEDADAINVTDDDATIQNNPNYTEPVKENDVMEDVGIQEEAVEDAGTEKIEQTDSDDDTAEKQKVENTKVGKEKDSTKEETMSSVKVEEETIEVMSDEDAEEAIIEDLFSDGDYEDEDDYDGDEEEEAPSRDATKHLLAGALAKSRKAPRYAVNFAKKHRVKLTIAAALFAFRKEIGRIAWHIVTKPKTIDPETGRVVSRTLNISPTSMIKIILFLDLMRKLNSGEVSETAGPVGSKGGFLFKLLHPSNTAFVPPIEQHWTFERVNERYEKDNMAFQKAMGTPGAALGTRKKPMGESLRSFATSSILGKSKDEKKDLVILMDWTKLTESLDQINSLRDQVSFLLSQHRAKNGISSNTTNATNVTETTEIVVLLESPGGAAADYGLAAQMMLRLSHEPGLEVTVVVDKVAASGGYMIACASSPGRLFAAPFSVLGSIGVVGSAINIHNVLQGWGVKPLVFRGGKNKAPVGLIGEVTKDGIKQVQNMVDATHVAFKRHVVAARPSLAKNINKLATGEVWLGYEALNVGLIDRIITSDEYIGERLMEGARVLRLVKYNKPRFLFPPHPPRMNLVHAPMNLIRKSVKAIMTEFKALADHTGTVDGIPLVATDSRLAAAASTSLGTWIQHPHGKAC